MRVEEDGVLEDSIDVTNISVDDFIIFVENTGGEASWINRKNEMHNRSIQTMVIEVLIDNNQHEQKCWCAAETSAEFYIFNIHSPLDHNSPHFLLYGNKQRTFVCDIYLIT